MSFSSFLLQGLLLGSENAGTNKHIIREAECVSQLQEHPMDYIIAFKFVCQECSDAPQARVFIGMEYFAGEYHCLRNFLDIYILFLMF